MARAGSAVQTPPRIEYKPGPDGDAESKASEESRQPPPAARVGDSAPCAAPPRSPRVGDRAEYFDLSHLDEPTTPRAALVSGVSEGFVHLTVFANPSLDIAGRGSMAVITRTRLPWTYGERPDLASRWARIVS